MTLMSTLSKQAQQDVLAALHRPLEESSKSLQPNKICKNEQQYVLTHDVSMLPSKTEYYSRHETLLLCGSFYFKIVYY